MADRFYNDLFKASGKIAVNCRTKEDLDSFLELCKKYKYKWNGYDSATDFTPPFNRHGEDTCIFLGGNRVLTWDRVYWAEVQHYPIFLYERGHIIETAPVKEMDLETTILFELQR